MSSHTTTTPSGELTHLGIARRYQFLIAVTMVLLLADNILMVLTPLLLGNAIDGLVADNLTPLWIFAGVALTGLAIGTVRRIYDTRAYGRIYRECAGETVAREIARDAPVSQLTARANFVSEFTDFFELMLPQALTSLITLGGAVVMLAILSPMLSAATVLTALIVGAVFYVSRHRITRFNTGLNNEMERQVTALETRETKKVAGHLAALVRWRIRLSDLEARNFGLAYFFVIALLVGAVYILIAVEGKSIGQAFAALTYVLQFTEAVIVLPYIYQQFIRTREIVARLAGG